MQSLLKTEKNNAKGLKMMRKGYVHALLVVCALCYMELITLIYLRMNMLGCFSVNKLSIHSMAINSIPPY